MKEILREIGMIERCFESISNIEFKKFNLAKGQYLYLIRICENPGIIQERVADMLKVDRTTASRSIKKLVSNGFVKKIQDPINKKILKLFPTEKGESIFLLLKKEEEYSDETALNGFSIEEKETILNLLRKIRYNIETDWELVKKKGKRKYLSESYILNNSINDGDANRIDIIEFEDKYHENLKKLSYEWLEKFVSVEPEDEKILNNPKEVIINKGGHIFFAKHDEEIVGTVSLIKTDNTTFELAKLAVTPNYQGRGIGRKLMDHCINAARIENAKKIILYTNHKLIQAISMYKKYGFIEVPLFNNKYKESDLKMELYL